MWPFSQKKKELSSAQLRTRFQEQGQWSQDLVADFSAYIEDTDLHFSIRDISKLPWQKDDLIRAFSFLLAITPEGEMREALKVTMWSIAQFQQGVGEIDLGPMPRFSRPMEELSADEMLAAVAAHEPIQKAFTKFQEKVEGERMGLQILWEQPSLI